MVFISSLSFAEVVCESPETLGDKGTEAGNIPANCNVTGTDTTVLVSDRNVKVDQVVKVLKTGPDDIEKIKEQSDGSGSTQ